MEFNATDILQSFVGYKGLPFPAVWFSARLNDGYTGDDFDVPSQQNNGYLGDDFDPQTITEPIKEYSNKGTALYKKDLMGNYYFMPVTFIANGTEYEIDCALVNITGKKNIISTPLVGRQGSVKELINIDDYQISITGVVVGETRMWPEEKLDAINELYNINEAIELKCALTDVFFNENDKVVITDLSIPSMPQTEHAQIIEFKCITDRALELIIV